ncbi:MAG: hypothetical protein IJT24_00480 [Lachnospiraceae bacterium]|nr:hypothetical protein [Lachnospiraceae bacterium]
MSALEKMRLPDDSLEAVTGGTNREMMELQRALGVNNISGIKNALLDMDIEATVLSSRQENEYRDIIHNEKLSHKELMDRLTAK